MIFDDISEAQDTCINTHHNTSLSSYSEMKMQPLRVVAKGNDTK